MIEKRIAMADSNVEIIKNSEEEINPRIIPDDWDIISIPRMTFAWDKDVPKNISKEEKEAVLQLIESFIYGDGNNDSEDQQEKQ